MITDKNTVAKSQTDSTRTAGEIVRINYKSDFDFLIHVPGADPLSTEFPQFDWTMILYTKEAGGGVFTAYSKDGVLTNCYNDNGAIRVVCNGHNLGLGELYGEFHVNIPNSMYADGKQLVVTPFSPNITLVSSAGDKATDIEVENALPVCYVTAYDLAVKQGYTGTAEEYMRATLELVETVEAAQTTLQQSLQAAQTAQNASQLALQTSSGAQTVLDDCKEAANTARQAAQDLFADSEIWAHTNRNNNFSTAQTVNGTLTINGDIVQNGEAYETHAEQVYTKKDLIITREGAEGGLGEGEVTGFKAKKYDGENDGLLVFNASGEARVGDEGDTQPLLTREEVSQLRDGDLLVWDAAKLRAVPLRKRIVDMEVTYEDDTTETFRVICEDESE